MWHPHDHDKCYPTPGILKNVKFQLSRNPTKFDVITRFRETNSTVKISSFQPKLPFYHFSKKLNFSPSFTICIFCFYLYVTMIMSKSTIIYHDNFFT